MKRPRFSLRALAILLTLVCAYFGTWEVTQRYGCSSVRGRSNRVIVGQADAICPFVVRDVDVETQQESLPYQNQPGFLSLFWVKRVHRYHVWIFGPTFQLPFEWKQVQLADPPQGRNLNHWSSWSFVP